MTKTYRPIRDDDEHPPFIVRLAEKLASDPALLDLRTRRLVLDIQEVTGYCKTTAMQAIGIARNITREWGGLGNGN